MPTVVRSKGYHVVVYSADHPPPHVHVRKDGANVRVLLLQGGVKLHSVKGKLPAAKIRKAGLICNDHLDDCWRVWRSLYE